MADGGAVLDPDTIRAAETLEDLQEAYQQEGVDVDTVEDAYAQAQQDWWEQVREDDTGSSAQLPGDSVTLSVEHGGETYTTTFHVHGVAHGNDLLPDSLPVSLELEDEVRDYLQDEVERFDQAGEPVYVEHGFGHVLYPDGTSVTLHDVGDQQALAEEMGEDFDRKFQLKLIAGGSYSKIAGLKDADVDQQAQTKKMMDMQNASMAALKDPDAIGDLQNAVEASHLPYHLEEEHGELVAEEMRDKADQMAQSSPSGFLDGVVNKAKQWAAESAADVGTDLEYRRSEIMVEAALPELYNEDVDDVRLVVGAGHHPSAVQYLEDLDESDLQTYAPGA